ncbi:hypothetical protein AAC387_Pa03g3831 [Persea americana]
METGVMSVRWVALTTNDPAYTVSCNDVNQCHMMPFFCMVCSTKPIHYFPGEFSLLQLVTGSMCREVANR